MTWFERTRNSVCRWWYYLAMYSGLRALLNCARSKFFALDPNIESLNGIQVSSEKLGELIFYVHPRSRPLAAKENGKYGVFSIQQQNPSIGRAAYRFFCQTSHFGCGHVEIAFYERGGEVTFYGVRNIARANASRIGLVNLSKRLQLIKRDEDALVLSAASRMLRTKGFETRHARPDECLNLAVNSRLLRYSVNVITLSTLYRKYDKLHAIIENRSA